MTAMAMAALVSILGFHRQKPIENQLVGIEVGGRTTSINPAMYRHRLDSTTLWETCNEKALQIVTVAEEPALCGYVANVEFSLADNLGACRDPTGALPDLHIQASTPRGIALGATEADIRKLYGKPWQAQDTRGEHYLRYRSKLKKHPSGAKGLVLVFTLRNGKTTSVSLGLTGPMFEKPPKNPKPCP